MSYFQEMEMPVDEKEEIEPCIESLRTIVEQRSFKVFAWGETKKERIANRLLVDVQSAQAALSVYDNLNDSNKAKSREMLASSRQSAEKFFKVCWKLVF
jgi:hypothetical protein